MFHSTGVYTSGLVFFKLIHYFLDRSLPHKIELLRTKRISDFLGDVNCSESFSCYLIDMVSCDKFLVDGNEKVAFLSVNTSTMS